jgi:hypothetical protein
MNSNELLKENLQRKSCQLTYELTLLTLIKCIALLSKRGANSKAISFLNEGLQLLIDQLKDIIKEFKIEIEINDLLKDLKKE